MKSKAMTKAVNTSEIFGIDVEITGISPEECLEIYNGNLEPLTVIRLLPAITLSLIRDILRLD